MNFSIFSSKLTHRLTSFLTGISISLVLMGSAGLLLAETPSNAARWLADVSRLQDRFLAQDDGNSRIIIIGGSSTLFGVDGRVLSELSGREVLMLGTHAAYSIRHHADRLRGSLRDGDIVLVPAEIGLYSREATTDFEQRQALIWGAQVGPQTLDARWRHLRLVWETPTETLLELGLSKILMEDRPLEYRQEADLFRAFDTLQSEDAYDYGTIYSWRRMDEDGAILVPGIATSRALNFFNREPGFRYLSQGHRVSELFIEQVAYLKDVVEQQGGTVLFLPPPTIDTVDNEADMARVEFFVEAARELQEQDILFACDSRDFIMPISNFLDTEYHLNSWGAGRRTITLANCLESVGMWDEINGGTAATRSRHLVDENHRLLRLRRATDRRPYDFEHRLRDLDSIVEALELYKADNGIYPVSDLWDGRQTNWGTSRDDWVPGLVPGYLPALPRDPRNNNNAHHQYLYRSNGADFKIIAHNPGSCDRVRAIAPEFIDPVRDCWAYGLWTEGARNW